MTQKQSPAAANDGTEQSRGENAGTNTSGDLAEYRALEQLIDDADRAEQEARNCSVVSRWTFGRMLLAEREANGGKQLPHHRLDHVCAAIGKSRREVQLRMRFAERYPTEDEVRNRCALLRWRDVIATLADPKAEEPPQPGEVIPISPGQLVIGEETHPSKLEAAANRKEEVGALERTRAELAEEPGIESPKTIAAEKLLNALRKMANSAGEVRQLSEMFPAFTLAELVREPDMEQKIDPLLRAIRDAYNAVGMPHYARKPMPKDWPMCDGAIQLQVAVNEESDVIEGTVVS